MPKAPAGGVKSLRRLLPSAVVAALAFAGLLGCRPADGDPEVEPPPPPVEAVAARHGALPLVETVNGVVRAANQVAIRPEIEAPVVEVLVRSGEAVEEGQVLVRLLDDALREQLRQAEASLRIAEAASAEARSRVAELEARARRTRALAAEELVSQLELETQEARLAAEEAAAAQAAARVEEARSTVQERRSALSKTRVRSPVAGRVGQRNAEVGMLAEPSTVLFLVGDLGQLIVEVPLTGEMLATLAEGQPVQIRSRGDGEEPVAATLSRISPFLDPGSFTTIGEIDVANRQDRLRPGMFVTVEIFYGESAEATLLPASALWEDPRTGLTQVFVVQDGDGLDAGGGDGAPSPPAEGRSPMITRSVEVRPVEILAAGRGRVGVSPVEPGEWVVTAGQHLLAGAEEGAALTARVRATTWERVLELQDLQQEDLLERFLDKQRRIARSRGAALPSNEEFLGGEG